MKRHYKIPRFKDFNFAKSRDEGDFLAPYTNRPLSKVISWIFVHFSVCAELLALFTPVIDLITIYWIASGNWVLAAIFVEVSLLFDSADGEVARFRATIKKRTEQQNAYGSYMDSMAGVLIFPIVIFTAGLSMENMLVGLLTMLSFCLINLSAGYGLLFPNKKEKSKSIQEGILGRIKKKLGIRGTVGFSGDIQKHIIALALLFQTTIFLWIYFGLAMAVVLAKFYLYRK